MALRAAWRLVVAKHRSLRPGIHRSGNRRRARSSRSLHSSWLRVVWARRATGVRATSPWSRSSRSASPLDQVHRLRGHRHGAHGLLVSGMADVEDGVPLAAPHLELVVDLGDQRAHRVDHHPATLAAAATTSGAEPWAPASAGHRRAPRPRRRRTPRREPGTSSHDVPVVDDLVVAVHGRLEDPHHPGQRLDGLLHPGAESPRLGQQDLRRHRPPATRPTTRRLARPGPV